MMKKRRKKNRSSKTPANWGFKEEKSFHPFLKKKHNQSKFLWPNRQKKPSGTNEKRKKKKKKPT